MAEVHCTRCGREAPGLERPPLPGDLGARIHAGVCGACWKQWLGEQVKLINETRISPADPDGYRFLESRMREFLRLDGDAANA